MIGKFERLLMKYGSFAKCLSVIRQKFPNDDKTLTSLTSHGKATIHLIYLK